MHHFRPDRPPPPDVIRIRTLLAQTRDTNAPGARFWALAVASQLIEEHLAFLDHRLGRPATPTRLARCRRARRAWECCLAAVRAELDRARRDTARD